jgi:hypothetical protein
MGEAEEGNEGRRKTKDEGGQETREGEHEAEARHGKKERTGEP